MCLRYGFIAVFIAVVFLRPDYSTVYALLILSRGHFLFIHQKTSLIVVHYFIPLFAIVIPALPAPHGGSFLFPVIFPLMLKSSHTAPLCVLSAAAAFFSRCWAYEGHRGRTCRPFPLCRNFSHRCRNPCTQPRCAPSVWLLRNSPAAEYAMGLGGIPLHFLISPDCT